MSTLFQLIFIAIAAVAANAYYALVLPESWSFWLAALIAAGMLLSMVSGRLDLGFMIKGGAALVAWPAGAIVIPFLAGKTGIQMTTGSAVAAAPIFACAASMIAYSVAEQRDRVRDLATITLTAIALYTIIWVMLSAHDSASARSLAALSVLSVVFTLKQMFIVPPMQERFLVLLMIGPAIGTLGSWL